MVLGLMSVPKVSASRIFSASARLNSYRHTDSSVALRPLRP